MANKNYINKPQDEEKKKRIDTHKEAAKSVRSKLATGSMVSVPTNTTKGMGRVQKGAAYNKQYGSYSMPKTKWYSGSKPTARETVARMYEVANGDRTKFKELETKFNAERSNRGSVIYNPYNQATNYKAIDTLAALGYDMSGGVTPEWLKKNQWMRNDARTVTGYSALAPSSKSTSAQDAAWAYEELLGAEERTVAAETELAAMAEEAKYWAGLGYSDNEIVKKLKSNKAYGTLWDMDEERQNGGALLLNRAVDYSGEDTMYGMIWAARNDGGTGNYFTDSVKYTMGQGNRYKADPNSEAARDPSNYEGYHPYYTGGTMHSLNQKYGVAGIDQQWLDDNRWMLNDPDKAEDYRKYQDAFDTSTKATAELDALDQWISQKMESQNTTAEDLVGMLKAAIIEGEEIRYRDKDGKPQTVKLSTLSKMEEARKDGIAIDTAFAIDFTLPRYIEKVEDSYAEKQAAMPETAEKDGFISSIWNAAVNWWTNFKQNWQYSTAAAWDGEKGSFGSDIDAVFDARQGVDDANKIIANYMKSEFGVDFTGSLTDKEAQIVMDAVAKVDVATRVGQSDEERAAAQDAAEELYRLGEFLVTDGSRRSVNTYKDDASYSTVFGEEKRKQQEDEYARGMTQGEFVPQAYVRDAGGPSGGLPQGDAPDYEALYMGMHTGEEEWSSEAFAWALQNSSNPDWLMAELRDGISKMLMGEEGTALSRSWMQKFGGLTRNTMADMNASKPLPGSQDINFDSRDRYGVRVKEAITANKNALDAGAISKEEYINNLIGVSVAAEAVENAKVPGYIVDPEKVLNANGGAVGAGVDAIIEKCNDALAAKEQEIAAEEDARKSLIISGRDAMLAGREPTEEERNAITAAMQAEILPIKKKDKTYKKYLTIIDSYGPDGDSYAAMQAQTDSFPDAKTAVDTAHSHGVAMLAEDMLEEDMKYAAALGLSLAEYYEEFPELSKSAEQILENANQTYNTAWLEFGNSAEGIQIMNEFLETGVMPGQESESAEIKTYSGPEYDMNAFDVFREASGIWASQLDLNLEKAAHFLNYDIGSEEEKTAKLTVKYGNSPEKLNEAWDKLLQDESIPESTRAELKTKLDTAVNIFDVGDPEEILSIKSISEGEAIIQGYRDTVKRNGTALENFACDAIVSAEDMISMMATAAVGNMYGIGSYAASLISTAPSKAADAYDYTREGADPNAVAMATMAAWVIEGKLEQMSLDRYLEPKINALDDAINHANYTLGKHKLFKALRSPTNFAIYAKSIGASGAKALMSGAGEFVEEGSQQLVSSAAENIVTGEGVLWSEGDVLEASKSGGMGFVLGTAAGGAIDSSITFTDEMQNEITAAEAAIDPAYEGNLINSALDFESTVAAIQASSEQLTQLQQSPENKALDQAEQEVESLEQEVAGLESDVATATEAQGNAALALDNVATESLQADAFTEEMGEQMVQAADALEKANQDKAKAEAKLEEARAKLAEAQMNRNGLADKVQAKYRQIMDAAKAKAEQEIADKYYNGSTDEQKAASERYRDACRRLEEARKALWEAKLQNGSNLQRGRALLAIDGLVAEVESAKAELDDAMANTPESKEQAAQRQELETATQAAQEAAAVAESEPTNAAKQAAADVAQARLEAVQAKQDMEGIRDSVRARLNSSNANIRSEAVSEWQAAQQKAADALQAAQDAEAVYNETDAQKQLKTALEVAQMYTTEQLLFSDEPGHEQAVQAYRNLQTARAAAEIEMKFNELNSTKIGTPEYDAALKAYEESKEAYENAIGVQYGTDGDTVRAFIGNLNNDAWNTLSGAERSSFFNKVGEIKAGKKAQFARSADGDYIFAIGNKLVYTDGNYDDPTIFKVIEIDLEDETDIDVARNLIYDSEKGVYTLEQAGRISETVFGKENVLRAHNGIRSATGQWQSGRTQQKGRGTDSRNKGGVKKWQATGDGWGDHRTPAKTGTETVADRNPIEILSDLTASIRAGYNPGGTMYSEGERMPAAVRAFYAPRANAITSRTSDAGDLVIGLHEFGHAVHARMPGLNPSQALMDGLSDGVRNAYRADELPGEAIAEFVIDYIFSRDEAVRQAGEEFVQDFENRLREIPELRNAIQNASDQVTLWNNASTGSKIGAMIKDGDDPRRGRIGSGLRRLLRKIETAVFDLNAPAKLVSEDFHRQALYNMVAGSKADIALTEFLVDPQGRNVGRSMAERIFDAGGTRDNMDLAMRYALARQALARREQNKDVFSPAEFSTEALESFVRDTEENNPTAVAVADAIVGFWQDFMQVWWVDTGMLDQADFDHMREMYPHYVPTFRVMGNNYQGYGGKEARFRMRGAVEGGSSLEVINPIASIIKMTHQMVNTVNQNELMRAFRREWNRGGLGYLADDVTQEYRVRRTNTPSLEEALTIAEMMGVADPALMEDAYAELLNLQTQWYGTGQNHAPNVVSGVDEDGREFYYRINPDSDLYGLLSGTSKRSSDLGKPLNVVRNFKNTFTRLTTGSNPIFAFKNVARDLQSSVNTGTHSLTYLGGMVRLIGAIRAIVQNDPDFQQFVAMGGGSHTRINTELNGRNANAVTREIGNALFRGMRNRNGDFEIRKSALERLTNILTLEQINNIIETANRYVEYRYGRHDKSTYEGRMEALMASQDVTTNFSTYGANKAIRTLTQIIPFMNATLQGLNKDAHIIGDLFSGNQTVRRRAVAKCSKMVMNTMLTAALQLLLLKMAKGKEDDEDYEILSQDMKTGNLIIPMTDDMKKVLGDNLGFSKPYIRVPLANGALSRAVYGLCLEIMSNVADYSPMEIDIWKLAKHCLNDSIPDSSIFAGLVDTLNNRTWYGGEIVSEYMQENYSPGNQYDTDTPGLLIAAGRALGVSPKKLEYLFDQYSGYAGQIILPAISPDPNTGEYGNGAMVRNVANSILGSYTVDPVKSNELRSYYKTAKGVIDQIVGDGNSGRPMNHLAFSANASEALDAAIYLQEEFAALDKEISAHWDRINDIMDSNMDRGDKARDVREIERESIIPLTMEAIALYEEYKMQYIDCDTLAQSISGLLPRGLKRPVVE